MPRLDRSLSARACCLALLASPAASWSAAFVPEDLAAVRQLLPALESADYLAREAVSKQLREDPRLALDAIGVAMAEPGISPEQAQRLVTAFKARFALSPRPALGIGLDLPDGEDRGIVVVELNRGLPAIDAGLLEWGDIIVALDGAKTVVSDPALPAGARQQIALNRTISLIQSYQPGESVLLEILRLKNREALFRDPALELLPQRDEDHPQEPAPQGVQRELGRMDAALLKRSMERERIEVRVPLGYYANLRNRGQVGGFGIGAAPGPDFSFLIQTYGDAAMEARLNRLGVKWPGGTPFDAASKMSEGHMAPPPAFAARGALALDGAGHDPAMGQGVGAFATREGLVFQGIDRDGRQLFRAGNGMIAVQQGVQVRMLPQGPQRGRARGVDVAADGGGLVGAMPAPVPGEASPSGVPGEPEAPAELVNASVDPSVERGLARLAALNSELARAERRAVDPALDPPTQREAEKRAAELRRAVEALVDAVSKGKAGALNSPTVEAGGEAAR